MKEETKSFLERLMKNLPKFELPGLVGEAKFKHNPNRAYFNIEGTIELIEESSQEFKGVKVVKILLKHKIDNQTLFYISDIKGLVNSKGIQLGDPVSANFTIHAVKSSNEVWFNNFTLTSIAIIVDSNK